MVYKKKKCSCNVVIPLILSAYVDSDNGSLYTDKFWKDTCVKESPAIKGPFSDPIRDKKEVNIVIKKTFVLSNNC